jgi:hypothetical protein
MSRQLTERAARIREALAAAFAELEANPGDDPKRKPLLVGVRQLLNSAKYVEGLLRDLRAD